MALVARSVAALVLVVSAAPAAGSAPAKTPVTPTLARDAVSPAVFEANVGQVDERVRFLGHGPDMSVFATPDEIVFTGARTGRIALAGSIEPIAESRLRSVGAYFLGDDPSAWVTAVPQFARVVYPGMRPGVDLVLTAGSRGVDVGLRWAPGADLRHLRDARATIASVGAASVAPGPSLAHSERMGGAGDDHAFAVSTDVLGNVYIAGSAVAPVYPPTSDSFGTRGGLDVMVTKLDPVGEVVYSVLLGGSAGDSAIALAVGPTGAAYVSGFTTSSDLPSVGGLGRAYGGEGDGFVVVVSPGGDALTFASYFGGSAFDYLHGIALDPLGGVAYATGWSRSNDFPVSTSAYRTTRSGDLDVVLVAIDTQTSGPASVPYSTYFGGLASDVGLAVAAGRDGHVWIAGGTASAGLPVVDPIQAALRGGNDAFVARFDTRAAGTESLEWSTFFGGARDEGALGVGLGPMGDVYITGRTKSDDIPLRSALQSARRGDFDGFVARIAPDGSDLVFSTYIGGTGYDFPHGLAVDTFGRAVLTGGTASADFPLVDPYQATPAGDLDAFVTVLSEDGSSIAFSSLIGGGDFDFGEAAAVDPFGNVYSAGHTFSADFPSTGATGWAPAPKDAFLVRFALGLRAVPVA